MPLVAAAGRGEGDLRGSRTLCRTGVLVGHSKLCRGGLGETNRDEVRAVGTDEVILDVDAVQRDVGAG